MSVLDTGCKGFSFGYHYYHQYHGLLERNGLRTEFLCSINNFYQRTWVIQHFYRYWYD